MKIGKARKLSVTAFIQEIQKGKIAPEFLTFRSSKPKVVSVDSKGKIRGKKKGTAVITACFVPGKQNSECTCKIRVKVS